MATGVSGTPADQNANPLGLVLYQVQAASGERRELARWTRPFPVNLIVMGYSANRLFVAAISLDAQTNSIHAGIDCFDAVSGKSLWSQSRDVVGARADLQFPLGLFAPHGENLVYSVGHDIWAVRAADGAAVDQQHEDAMIASNWIRQPFQEGPVYFVNSRDELVAYDDVQKTVTRKPAPDLNSPFLQIHGNVLVGFSSSYVRPTI